MASTTASAGARTKPARVKRSWRERGHALLGDVDCEGEVSGLLEVEVETEVGNGFEVADDD